MLAYVQGALAASGMERVEKVICISAHRCGERRVDHRRRARGPRRVHQRPREGRGVGGERVERPGDRAWARRRQPRVECARAARRRGRRRRRGAARLRRRRRRRPRRRLRWSQRRRLRGRLRPLRRSLHPGALLRWCGLEEVMELGWRDERGERGDLELLHRVPRLRRRHRRHLRDRALDIRKELRPSDEVAARWALARGAAVAHRELERGRVDGRLHRCEHARALARARR